MHNDLALIEQRVRRALERQLRPAIHRAVKPLTVAAWKAPREATFADARAARYQPLTVRDCWGAPWSTTWFELSGAVPADWAGETVEAIVDLGWPAGTAGFSAEGLVYDADGSELKGLASGNPWIPVALGARELRVWVQAAANPRIAPETAALGDPATAGDAPLYRLTRAELAVRRADAAALVID